MKKIKYTMRSQFTNILYTFTDTQEDIRRQVAKLVEYGYVLEGVDGIDGYVSPNTDPLFAHNLGEK